MQAFGWADIGRVLNLLLYYNLSKLRPIQLQPAIF